MVYRYFDGKVDLLRAVRERALNAWAESVTEATEESATALGALEAMIDETFRFANARPEFRAFLLGDARLALHDQDSNRDVVAEAAKRRTELGRAKYQEVMVHEAPPPNSPFTSNGVVDSVFGELWGRPGLTRRDRRWITLACVAAAATVDERIQTHVYAALASKDTTPEEFQEFVLHLAYYAGWPRASSMEMAYYRTMARLDTERAV